MSCMVIVVRRGTSEQWRRQSRRWGSRLCAQEHRSLESGQVLLKRRPRWAEGILLPQQFRIDVPPSHEIAMWRSCVRITSRSSISKVERTQGLRGIEGQHQLLGPRLAGDPSPPSTGAAEVSPVGHQPTHSFLMAREQGAGRIEMSPSA